MSHMLFGNFASEFSNIDRAVFAVLDFLLNSFDMSKYK